MTLRAVLDWANPDSTADLNSRFTALFTKGVITGGVIVPIVGALQISLQPFTAMSNDGMLITNDAATVLDIPTDRTNVIAVHAVHQIGDAAILEIVAIEAGALASEIDKDYYVVFGAVTTNSPATQVAETDIDYSLRETQDKRTRDKLRGQVSDIADLPADPNFNVYGDMYVVYTSIGSPPNIYAWDGLQWDNITGTYAVAQALLKHQENLDTDLYPADPANLIGRLHVSNDQKDAALGSYGTPGLTNRYVTQLDPRIPTNTPDGGQSSALLGSDGTPSNLNRYITQEYPIAAPTVLSLAAPALTLIDMSVLGPVYVGKGAVDSANVYFSLMDYTNNRGYLNSSGIPCKINAVYKTIAPFVKLNPSTDSQVDSYGFYQGANIYLGIDVDVDTSCRLVYGKETFLKTADHGFPILPTPTYEIISGTLLSKIAEITGRSFDTTVPTNEQNINLRADIDSISEYIGSVLETNVIAGNEDFTRLSSEFSIFKANVGVDYKFTFENLGISQFVYTPATGTVLYYSAVDLSSVAIGDLFIDGAGNNYELWAIGALGTYTIQIKNVGSIPPVYPSSISGAYPQSALTSVDGAIIRLNVLTFSNTSTVGFTWNTTNNWVQFSSNVNLSSVNIGDLFRDGGGTYYLVTAVDDPNNRITIITLDTGLSPLSINTSVGSYLDGSTRINNNPRNLLLSEMKFNYGAEFIPVKQLVRKTDEYSLPDGQVAYGILRFDGRFDPRIVFYGSWQNYSTYAGETYVRNSDGFGRFLLSGYFTDVFIAMRRRTNSGTLAIKINGVSSTTIDPTATNTVSSNVASLNGPKYELVKLNSSSLSDSLPTTLTGTLPSVTSTDSFDVYGFVFVRNTIPLLKTTALLESGRAFDSAHIVRRDMPNGNVTVDVATYQSRGGRLVYAVETNAYSRVISSLNDLDSNGVPNGTWTGTTITLLTTGGKLPFYSVNDIIMVYAATEAKLCRIASINTTLNTITVDLSPAVGGESVTLLHICSSDSVNSLASQESQIAHYIVPNDFINNTSTDLSYILQSNRFVIGPDSLTVLAGQNILVTTANVIGTQKAVQIQQGSSGALQLTVLATRLDLLCVNNAAATILVSIDGSPEYLYTINAMAQRRTIFSNARYQTHEVKIRVNSVGGTFSFAEMMLFGPAQPQFSSFPNIVADLSQIATYQASFSTLTLTPNIFPTGAVFREATSHLSYLNGTGSGSNFSVTLDFTKALNYGYYVSSDREGSYVEFYIQNSAFELQYITGPDHGYFHVFIDGVDIASYLGLTGLGIFVVGSYDASNGIDAYSASYGRKNIGVYSSNSSVLLNGLHKITAKINTPRGKNGSSSGYKMAFTGFYEGNYNGLMTLGINKYGVYSSIVDTRLFNPLPSSITTSVQTTQPLTRQAIVNLNIGTTSMIVTLAQPYTDTNYIVVPCFINTVDAYPYLQPLMVTAQTKSTFTVAWNVPIPNGNYSINYYTMTLDV